MYIRYGKLAYEREEAGTGDNTLHADASKWIGPVEHNHLLAVLCRRLHQEPEGADESVRPRANVLYVVNKDIHITQHLRRRLAGFPVKTPDCEAGCGIFLRGYMLAGGELATDTVLRTVQRHQVDAWGVEENVNR
jgi:hypothetical protein